MNMLDSIPEAILPSIFKFLPLEDLKEWRRLGNYWYKNSSVKEIVRREKFRFHYALCDGDAVILGKHILKCKRVRAVVEFHGFSLKGLPLTVWKHFGETLTSLTIHDCYINDDLVTEVIRKCPNLVYLHLQVKLTYAHRLFSSKKSLKCLDDLIADGVRRLKLRSFKLFTYYFPILDAAFDKLFAIFPNLEVFGRDFGVEDTPVNAIIEFFSKLNQSVKIDLRVIMTETHLSQDVKTLLLQVLKTLESRVRVLHVTSVSHSIAFTEAEFKDFLNGIKHLESLNLEFFDFLVDSDSSLPPFQFNLLTDLRLSGRTDNMNRLCLEILQRCTSSLKYLVLYCSSIETPVLDCIFRYHIELKKLSIFTEEYKDLSDIRTLYSERIGQFQNLEFWDLNLPSSSQIHETSFKLNCSKLKVFQARNITPENLPKFLKILSHKAPLLETLSLQPTCRLTSMDQCLLYFRKFRKLRCLIFHERWDIEKDAVMEDLFDLCSSLTYVVFPNKNSSTIISRSMGSQGLKTWNLDAIDTLSILSVYRPVEYTL